jgi:hypothetical protein
MTHIVHPILLCGGSGTRLWPLSRKSYPKQFAKLMGAYSLFQSSAQRMVGQGFAPPMGGAYKWQVFSITLGGEIRILEECLVVLYGIRQGL